MRHRALLLLAFGLLAGCGDEFYTQVPTDGHTDCTAIGESDWTRISDNPRHCGGCGIVCPAGVPCVDYECRMDSVLHCGAAGRQCFAAGDGPRAMACIDFRDDEAPPGIELVGGHGCVQIEPPRVEVDGEPPANAAKLGGRWLTFAGHTPGCADGLDSPACRTAEVSWTGLCEESIGARLPYDFAIMTDEMSRGQYRELMCDCTEPKAGKCVRLCAERDAPDGGTLAAQPMTGVNWCEAYAACKRLDARLPTAHELALLEAEVNAPKALFDEALSCGAWADETGRVPWLAECLDTPLDELGLDDVKGAAGRVFVAGAGLAEPEAVHHLIGNVSEWLADPLSALNAKPDQRGVFWGLPVGGDAFTQPRLVRGRSLFSPAGLPGAQLIAVEPSVRTRDLGLRCARTVDSPFAEPVPYDVSHLAEDYAYCEVEPIGLRPVRRSMGEQVFRATDVCFDDERDLPADFYEKLLTRGRELFVHGRDFGPLARRAISGELAALGPARFAMDEQWWLVEPARQRDATLEFRIADEPIRLAWRGEEMPRTSRCMAMAGDDPSTAEAYSRLVRRHEFMLAAQFAWLLGIDGAALACAHLDCVEDVEPATCATECPGWWLPLAIEFQPVEPGSGALVCR